MLDLSIKNTAWSPKNYHLNLRREDNLSLKDKTAEFVLSPKCPLFGGSIVVDNHDNYYTQTTDQFS